MIKLIPFTKGFYADDKCNIYDKNKIKRTQYTNGCGYKTCSVLTEDDRWVTFGVQRLIALAFKPPEKDHLLLTVNHRDGCIQNNTPDNLEWISNELNILHGTLLNRFSNRPLILGEKGGEVVYFNDLVDASIYLDVDVDSVWDAIKTQESLNGWKLKHIKGSSAEAAAIKFRRPLDVSTKKRPLVLFDMTTKEITEYDSIQSLASSLGLPTSRVHQRISTPGFPKVFRKNFIIIDKGEDQSIFHQPPPQNSFNNLPKKIICYNLSSGEFTVFSSVYSFVKQNKGVSKKAVWRRVTLGLLSPVGEWIIKSLSDLEEDKRVILEMARSTK